MLDQVLTGLIENFTQLTCWEPYSGASHSSWRSTEVASYCPNQPESDAFLNPKSLGQMLMFQPETEYQPNLTATKHLFQTIGGFIVRQRPQQGKC